jgi:hypothetical protein
MTIAAILVAALVVLVALFSIAKLVFGPACSVLLTGGVGYCFGGPPAAGVGLVIGLLLVPLTYVVGAVFERDE